MRDLVLNWGINCFSGWGNVGVSLLTQLAKSESFRPIAAHPFDGNSIVGMDPLRFRTLKPIIQASSSWAYHPDCIWIDPIGNNLATPTDVQPKVHIARVIVEKPELDKALERLSKYDALLTASYWNAQLIEQATGRYPKVIHEGIDTSLFSPGGKSGTLKEGFYIYAAGKVEYRKAQDVVLKAFKTFSERHKEAILVTAWQSPFADLANGYKGTLKEPLWVNEHSMLDIRDWAARNGIDAERVIDLGSFPNYVLPSILREMDVMLSPTRVESCTCLPVMEALACGIPAIYGYHTGMKDLNKAGLPLFECKEIEASNEYFFPQNDIPWYEADLDEIDSQLETVYQHRESQSWRDWWTPHTWAQHASELERWLKSLL